MVQSSNIQELSPRLKIQGQGEELQLQLQGHWVYVRELDHVPEPLGLELCQALARCWQIMPGSSSELAALELPKLFMKRKLERPLSEEIVFYGGSFDPWHEGHLACLELCPVKNIVVIPDSSPWKPQTEARARNWWNEYYQLCKRLEHTPYSLYSGFWGRSRPNPTVAWLPFVAAAKKSLLIGEDNFLALHKWQDYQTLIAALKCIYVAPRGGDSEAFKAQTDRLKGLRPGLELAYLSRHAYEHLSSSQLRNKA